MEGQVTDMEQEVIITSNNPIAPFQWQTTSSPPFFLRDSTAGETRARVKITPREHARSRFARSTLPEEKWWTTRSLFQWPQWWPAGSKTMERCIKSDNALARRSGIILYIT